MLTRELQETLSQASNDALKRRHEFITLEHILYAMTSDKEAQEIFINCGADPAVLQKQLDQFLKEKVEKMPKGFDGHPEVTAALERTFQRAALHAQSSAKEYIDCGALLASMFYERRSHGVYLLETAGVSRFDVINYISHGIGKTGDYSSTQSDPASGEDGSSESPEQADPVTIDLLEQARKNLIDPLIGREEEIQRTIQVLCRRRKNNPVYVGEPGVGKTAIAEGLALKIARGEVPEALKAAHVYSLDLGALVAGAKFKGEFEARLKKVIKEMISKPGSILFIDEIHNIVRPGNTEGGSMDASNILKPALASGKLRCIGSTTYSDYKASFEKDKALARRFQKVDVIEPSVSDTVKILKGLKKHYEEYHGVTYPDETLEAAAELAGRHINDRFLPDKAVDVMDETGAKVKLVPDGERKDRVVTVQDVEDTIASMAKIPPKTVTGTDKERLKSLDSELKAVIFGQNHAVDQLTRAIKLSRSGLAHPDKPIGSFLFSGPTGVGKTELAKQMALILGVNFIRFDMSEYMESHTVSRLIGAPPGYVGFDQGGLLTDAVNKTPHCVVVMDEIEKAHPDIFNILLQVMDHGTLTDNNGKKADFRNVILIMTTNAGAREMMNDNIGFRGTSAKQSLAESLAEEAKRALKQANEEAAGASKEETPSFGMGKGRGAIERTFAPEFRNRLDGWIVFNPLSMANILQVVDKFLNEVKERLVEKNVTVEVTEQARLWLAEHGYDKYFGARPMGRLIKEKVSVPLSEELLFGKLQHGGKVAVDAEEVSDKLTVECTPGDAG